MNTVKGVKLAEQHARRIFVCGQVQGVGFRPFVYRLAHELKLSGTVCNRLGQVELVIQGREQSLTQFEQSLIESAPPIAQVTIVSSEAIDVIDCEDFRILPSEAGGEAAIHVPPDYFCCSACLSELYYPENRRFGYAFINCTQCGPRYSLINRLPYDRPNTSMASFELCKACEKEYSNPLDRRFHAQPIACPDCGPELRYQTQVVNNVQSPDTPMTQAVKALHRGEIVAVKGIGGYHLMCDAQNNAAVDRLRERKQRPHKPLAIMLATLQGQAGPELDQLLNPDVIETKTLEQVSRPIVLVRKRPGSRLAAAIAPGLNEIGVMLAYSPLHDLLLHQFGGPLVATSGNVSGEPVITSNAMAQKRLAVIADGFLHHDRPIVRPVDDSVVRVMAGRARTLRAGRGITPMEIALPRSLSEPILALGGHMKVTVALAWENKMIISPHVGEMGSPRSLAVFETLVDDLQSLYGVSAARLVCDAHPGYTSHKWAISHTLPVSTVWHHHAHASAALLETSGLEASDVLHKSSVLAFTWDGVGLGPDNTLWGGETLIGRPGKWQRYARWRPFNVPGGDLAGRAPWRSAAALCWTLEQDSPAFSSVSDDQLQFLKSAWHQQINSPQTTAVGRLFDAAAALLGLAEEASFEGQGPMLLEALAESEIGQALDLEITALPSDEGLQIDWAPLVQHMQNPALSKNQRAADWHETLAQVILKLALRARFEHSIVNVALSGGVFQNRMLNERALDLLCARGFSCHFPERLPVNDGSLCAGQVNEFLHRSIK